MPFRNIAKIKIGILGAGGFLGGNLFDDFRNFGSKTVGIGRENYNALKGSAFDVLINANGNSKRFWANQNPLSDFEASTLSVYKSIFDFKFKKYIYISSSDVYPFHHQPKKSLEAAVIEEELLCPYGFNKYLAEKIVKRYCGDYLILRCSAMLGKNLKKGPIKDILDGAPLFIGLDSKLQFILTEKIAEIIKILIESGVKNEIFNVGGRGAFDFNKAESIFNKKIKIRPGAETQHYEMSVEKLNKIFSLKTSEEYLEEFVKNYV